MAIEVTDDLVRHVARLSRLALSPEEAGGLKEHFEKILAFIGSFQALDTSDVDPSHFAAGQSNVFRDDAAGASLERPAALGNAPHAGNGYFIVPRIVGGAAEPAVEDGGGSA